jgi:hypothetical protein
MEMEMEMETEMEMGVGVRRLMEVVIHLVRVPMSGCYNMLKVVFGCWVMRFQGVFFIVFG